MTRRNRDLMSDCDRFKLRLERMGDLAGDNRSPTQGENRAPGSTSLDTEREALLKENERLKEYLNQYES